MAKLTLSDVANLLGNPTTAATTINANNDAIEAALENTLSRNGTTPNQMAADLDMNNNDVLNVATLTATDVLLSGVSIEDTVQQAVAAAAAAAVSAAEAEASAQSISPMVYEDFYVNPSGGTVDSVTITGGYTIGAVAWVSLNGILIQGWSATDGTTVTGLAITTADLVDGDTTVWVRVAIGEPLSGTDILDGRYVLQTEKGRDIGDVLTYEDFGGFPSLITNSRFIFNKPTPTLTDAWNVGVLRNVSSLTGGIPGFVNAALLVNTTVDTVTSFEWGFLSTLTVNGAGGGEHCAGYFQGVKNGDNALWALCTELREYTTDPTTGSLGIEIGMFVTGTDAHGSRHGIDMSIGSADNLTGTNVVTTGIRIGPSVGDANRAQLVTGIDIRGRAMTGVDLSNLDVAYSDVTIKVPTNGKIRWKDGDGFGGATRAELAWNDAINTWQLSGVKTQVSAGAAATYAVLQINGTEYAVELRALA